MIDDFAWSGGKRLAGQIRPGQAEISAGSAVLRSDVAKSVTIPT